MKIFTKIISMAALAMSVVGCSYEAIENDYNRPEQVLSEAGFALPTNGTRVSLGDDGATTNWEIGDNIYLWAENANGEYVAENVKFMLRYFSTEYSEAFFSGDMPQMEAGEYSYKLVYPAPTSVSGSKISYTLPAVQDGIYNDNYDVMVAAPVVAPEITGGSRVVLNAIMKHRMHALKITLPSSSNNFGSRFETLTITFPKAVVGDMIIDLDNPDAEPTYANTSNTITLTRDGGFDFDTPIWVFVLPGTADGDLSYQVSTEISVSAVKTFAISRNLEAGNVTPIRMATPAVERYTTISFSVGANNLGEDFNSFSVYTPNESKPIASFARNASNLYTMNITTTALFNSLQNKTIRVVYDTPNTNVETSISTGTLTKLSDNNYTITVPYLFAEDFSGISGFGDGHDNPATGVSSDTYNDGTLFSAYSSDARMAGWSGGRYQVNGALRLCCRSECGMYILANYRGRVDTAPLSKIKSGVSAKVRVRFNYGDNFTAYNLSGNTLMSFGHTTTQGAIAPSTDVSNAAVSNLSIKAKTASFTNVPSSYDVTLTGCTSATRLTWMAGTNVGRKFAGNANSWLYIDNIRVSIAQ